MNLIGGKSAVDIGSNLGGFLFYLEQFAGLSTLVGIEGDRRFVAECEKVAELLHSRVRFINRDVMRVAPPVTPMDVLILQNVYHYIYDKVGEHDAIFKHLARHGRSIIWYNPMSERDPVIPAHAHSNPNVDWTAYNKRSIFGAAIKAGFLQPVPLKLRFSGMGETREHWLFVTDRVVRSRPATISTRDITGESIALREHFRDVHRVWLSESRSYKVFEKPATMRVIQSMVELGVLDERLCGDLQYIADDDGRVVGYSQPRGIELATARNILGKEAVDSDYMRQVWRLYSRMIRHDCFNHDIGSHNFVVLPSERVPILIDLENFVMTASQGRRLSIYKREPDDKEIRGAEANLKLIFRDVDVQIRGRDPISVLWDCLERGEFLSKLNLAGVLEDW